MVNDCVSSVYLQDLQEIEDHLRGNGQPQPHLLALEVTSSNCSSPYITALSNVIQFHAQMNV